MSRLAALSRETMTDRQKEVHDAITSGPRGRVAGPLAIWLNRPELADRAQALGRYCRFESSLPPRLSELAILTTARFWSAEYEWAAHKPLALKAGLSESIVEAIRAHDEPEFDRQDEAVVYRFSNQLHRTRQMDDQLYTRAIDLLGADGVVDLTGILGYYTLISMTIKVFDVDPPEGYEPELG